MNQAIEKVKLPGADIGRWTALAKARNIRLDE